MVDRFAADADPHDLWVLIMEAIETATGNPDQPQIVAGGGWNVREVYGRPKARFCGFLATVWSPVFVVSLIAIGATWGNPLGTFWLKSLCVLFIVAQLVFLTLALAFWLFEVPKTFRIMERAEVK
jgi:hypothetical protein